jgi:molybdopterin-biosynthesis enzyme MoeA-like protein
MTELPEGSELIETPDLWFPLVKIENVFVFPGIPRLLQAKFNGARERFVGRKIYLRKVFLACIETDIAGDLNAVVAAFPELMIGSYPRIGEDSFRTLITLESRDEAYVLRGVDALVGRIPADYVIKVE